MLSEANVWSRFEFQQLYQSSPLLSPNCFSLKQIPVLNLNCKDSLGFPSFFAQKDFLFSWFQPRSCRPKKGFLFLVSMTKKRFASLFFSLPKWLALHFQNVCIIFLFIAQMGFFGTSGGQLGFWLEGLGAQLGILWDPSRLGSFGGPSFLGFWEHPKVKFSKSRPCF